ncbi:hypothetical protein [Chryseobacterium sp. Leaf394]|nr:hypothetical protein [Chryseobacterium sp. Leaf394]
MSEIFMQKSGNRKYDIQKVTFPKGQQNILALENLRSSYKEIISKF